MSNTIDLITLNKERSALFVNRQRLRASNDTDKMTKLAHTISESLTTENRFNHYQCSANDALTWGMAEKSVYKAIDSGSVTNSRDVPPIDDVPELLDDDELDNQLEGLAKGMRSAFRRSVQRMAAFDSDTMGKYFNSMVATIGGTLATYGALEGNPLLAEYLTEINIATMGAATMSIYGAGMAVAASANQSLIQKYPAYQDKVNQHLMNKLDSVLNKEGVQSPEGLTPKQKAEFSELVKIHYGTEQGIEMTTALFEMYKLENEPQHAAEKDNAADSTLDSVNNPGVTLGR